MNRVHQILKAFERAGFRYWDFGTSKQGRKKLGEWYKGAGLTDAGKAALQAEFPTVQFLVSVSQYAPEIRAQVVFFPCEVQS